jgi:glycosyltransferase involved in cell wall biosynthesis
MEDKNTNFSGPIVSVVIPTYNRKHSIKRSIESVLVQSYDNIEIIIVDDASTDGTNGVIYEFAKNKPNIIVIKNKNNLGLVDSLNRGVELAKGKYIARLDDDDYWCNKDKIRKQVEFLERNLDYVLTGGGAVKIDQAGKEITRYLLPEKDLDIRKRILTGDAIVHTAVVFRKDCFEKVKGYEKKFDGIEDWDLWLKMGLIGKFYNMPEFFVIYTGHDKNNLSYFEKKYGGTKRLKFSIKLIKKYRYFYPGYKKAISHRLASYAYSFMPFDDQFRSILFKLKKSL